MFELEQKHGTNSIADVSLTVKTELVELWDYAGYGDILKTHGNILVQLKALRAALRDLTKVPVARRSKDFFKKKEEAFLSFLGGLFDITVKSKQTSHLITDVDRDFLQNHWDKVISSTKDMGVRSSVKKPCWPRFKVTDNFKFMSF